MTPGSIILGGGQGGIALAGALLLQIQIGALFTFDSINALAMAWEWLVLLALAFWIGMLLCEGMVVHGIARASTLLARAQRQTRPLHWLCLAALFVGNIVALILRAAQLTTTPGLSTISHILLTPPYGSLWLARTGLIILAAALTLFVRQARRAAASSGLIIAGLILLTLVFAGNAGATALTWLSLATQLTWFGVLCYLGYILLPLVRNIEPDRHAETLIELLRRLSPLLLGVAALLFVSNIYESVSFSGTLAQFAASTRGQIQLARWLLIVVMLAFGGYILFVLRPRVVRQAALLPVVNAELPARRARQSALEQTTRALKRASILSAGFGALVLLCSALLIFIVGNK